jgi:Na+-translocating ferredoxin:NAD+ oxidoreductase RnfA subunit
MYNMVLYLCVLIVFSLRRESLKLILVADPFRGGSVTTILISIVHRHVKQV